MDLRVRKPPRARASHRRQNSHPLNILDSPLESRLSGIATGITACPSNVALARLEEPTDVREKPHRSNQRERPDVGIWEGLVQSRGGGQDCATLGNNVVDEDNSVG